MYMVHKQAQKFFIKVASRNFQSVGICVGFKYEISRAEKGRTPMF